MLCEKEKEEEKARKEETDKERTSRSQQEKGNQRWNFVSTLLILLALSMEPQLGTFAEKLRTFLQLSAIDHGTAKQRVRGGRNFLLPTYRLRDVCHGTWAEPVLCIASRFARSADASASSAGNLLVMSFSALLASTLERTARL